LTTAAERDGIAASWAARLDRAPLSPSEQAVLDQWTAADTRNAGALARAMAANAYLDRAGALGADYRPTEDTPPAAFTRRAWLTAAAGAIAASLVAVVGSHYLFRPEHLSVAKGGVRRAVLADGSAVTLNSGSEVAVRLQQQARAVDLMSGEAIFDVAKDSRRPFIVAAGNVRVRAIGTSFVVRLLDAKQVLVRVREGIVAVDADDGTALRLIAGEQAMLRAGRRPDLRRLSQADLRRSELWKDGLLDLTGLTLGDAAAEFARYSDRPILVDGAATARLKVAGIYSTNDPVSFAEAAALSLDLNVTKTSGAIRISRKD
jgi:transmembrane sensor